MNTVCDRIAAIAKTRANTQRKLQISASISNECLFFKLN